MRAAAVEKKSFKQLAKEKKGKIALLSLMALVSVYIWSGIVFGKKESGPSKAEAMASLENPVQPGAAAPASAPAAGPASASGAAVAATTRQPSPLGPIRTFDAAMLRIESWEEPLRLHLEADKPDIESIIPALEDPVFEPQESIYDEEVDELTLSGTAIFGNSKFALINDKRLQVGDKIGRYVVEEIRAREVQLSEQNKIHVLRMAEPQLSKKTKRSSLEEL